MKNYYQVLCSVALAIFSIATVALSPHCSAGIATDELAEIKKKLAKTGLEERDFGNDKTPKTYAKMTGAQFNEGNMVSCFTDSGTHQALQQATPAGSGNGRVA
jgi:hypothetical protein